MLAEYTRTKNYSMMFLSQKIKASLVSIHEPIRKVAGFIKEKQLHSIFDVVINSLNNDFNLLNPKIAVLGLNPHAGENGAIGKEELNIIVPAIKNYAFNKFISGPFSPDAFFANRSYKQYDMVVGMYHDQLLIPFKLLNFGGGVNYTAGLPIIRTSPDHGTAYDIAGKNMASPSSMIQAYKYALAILKNRKRNGCYL
jgi:4-hydroxy-L-threonine phosphate dehydrogenase PdxA